jgi:uncharacterized protein YecE (DUF72 family)
MATRSHQIRIGTCGFAEAQVRCFDDFDIVEIQQSFYQPPRASTVARWRAMAPPDFVFAIKAWQLLTHAPSSPTYRRLKQPLSDTELAQAGGFRWNALTRMAWQRTREIADALGARAVLFQTPRSFTPSRDNLRRLRGFFERIDRDGRRMAFEPRGEAWDDATLRSLVVDLDLVHVVDPFLRAPLGRGLRYFRLHGRPAYRYHYRYSDADLHRLEAALSRAWTNWVLFNNDAMAEDARRFIARLGGM